MYLNLKEIKWIPFCMCMVLAVRVAVSLHVFPAMQKISYLVLALCILFFLIMAVLCLREKKLTNFTFTIILYFSLLAAFSVINFENSKFRQVVYEFIEIQLFLSLFSYYIKNISVIIKSFAFAFSIIIYGNLVIMLFFPQWMFAAEDIFDSFLLGGNYNQIGCRLLCGIVTSIVCIKYSKWWILNTVLLFIVSFITLLVVGSMTSTANLIIYALFCLIPSFHIRKIAIVGLFFVFVFFQVFVVFNGEGIQHNELAVYIIEDVLGKDITFTNRTYLWDSAGKLFVESPLIGYGHVNMDWYKSNLSGVALGPHNFVFSVLIHGGIVLFSCYILICLTSLKRFMPKFDSMASYILMGLVTLMFMMTMEVYPFFYVVYFLTLGYYYGEIKDSFSKKKIK